MRSALNSLLHLQDPPHRTALAFGTGVFIAFSPLFGLHTVLAIILAFAFRLNRVAVVAGAWINVWALAPCYAFGTFLGAWLLRVDAGDLKAIDWSQGMGALGTTLSTLFWPIMVGEHAARGHCRGARLSPLPQVPRGASRPQDRGARSALVFS
jgi:uncharacterized protein (DUF2062 family)